MYHKRRLCFYRNVVFVVGNVGGAVKEQTASADALGAPLGILAVSIGCVGKMVVHVCIWEVAGLVGDGDALAFVKGQM